MELTIIPAQCGVSLVRSEGLMATMRKATAMTATPNSSWSRATSRGKRQPLHLLLSSGAGLSSLLFMPSFLSEEAFCPCPISPLAFTLCCPLSVLSTFSVAMFGVDQSARCLLPVASLLSFLPFPSQLRPPLTINPAWLLFGNRQGSELIWKTFGLDS